jgi:hypothetical protein
LAASFRVIGVFGDSPLFDSNSPLSSSSALLWEEPTCGVYLIPSVQAIVLRHGPVPPSVAAIRMAEAAASDHPGWSTFVDCTDAPKDCQCRYCQSDSSVVVPSPAEWPRRAKVQLASMDDQVHKLHGHLVAANYAGALYYFPLENVWFIHWSGSLFSLADYDWILEQSKQAGKLFSMPHLIVDPTNRFKIPDGLLERLKNAMVYLSDCGLSTLSFIGVEYPTTIIDIWPELPPRFSNRLNVRLAPSITEALAELKALKAPSPGSAAA